MQARLLALYACCWCPAFGDVELREVSIHSSGNVEEFVAAVSSVMDWDLAEVALDEDDHVELLQRSLDPSAAVQPHVTECDWTVYYDRWIPSPSFGREFDVAYAHGGREGGAEHCLKVCCRDPTCVGLSTTSDLSQQCYKYDKMPDALGDSGQPLNLFMAGGNPHEAKWSVLIKSARAASSHGDTLVNREGELDEKLARIAQVPVVAPINAYTPVASSNCEWDVHYDRWLPTFSNKNNYFHAAGGAHCLDLCCADPSCTGIAMDAWETKQCYKYDSWPVGLDHGGGRRLGDGKWLLHEKDAWSIVMKVGPSKVPPAPPPSSTLSAPVLASLSALVLVVMMWHRWVRDSRGKDNQSEAWPLAVRARKTTRNG